MDLHTKATRMVTVADCKRVFANAKPEERKQIKGFVEHCTAPKLLVNGKWKANTPWEGVPYWLTYIRHLNSGRIMLTAGCAQPSLGEQGLNANQMREVVGLPKVKGGDYKVVTRKPAPVKQPVKRPVKQPVRRK